jgi:hypothetical protein
MAATTLGAVRKGGLFTTKHNGKQIYIKAENDTRTGLVLCRKILYKNDRFLWPTSKIVYSLSNKQL